METVTGTMAIYRDKRRRVWELDFLRGIAVIAMCFDHLMCDFAFLYGWFGNFAAVNNPFVMWMYDMARKYWYSDFRFWAHYIFVFIFLFLVGNSCSFSRDNARRGSLLAIVAIAFTGATMILRQMGVMRYGVVFGILDCIALSILIVAAVDSLTQSFKEFNVFIPLLLGVGIIAAGIGMRFWTWPSTVTWDRVFDASRLFDYMFGSAAFGDDWFPVFPYVGAVLVGMYFGKTVYPTRASVMPGLDGKWNKPFRFVGRHALWFYLFHQPVLSGLVMLLCLCLGYSF